jgi:hypothetical protein
MNEDLEKKLLSKKKKWNIQSEMLVPYFYFFRKCKFEKNIEKRTISSILIGGVQCQEIQERKEKNGV